MNVDQGRHDTAENATLWGLYREIHEAVRDVLFGVSTLEGQGEATRIDAGRRLLEAWRRVAAAPDVRRPDVEGAHELPARRAIEQPTPHEVARPRTDAALARLQRLAKDWVQPVRSAQACRLCGRRDMVKRAARGPLSSAGKSATKARR